MSTTPTPTVHTPTAAPPSRTVGWQLLTIGAPLLLAALLTLHPADPFDPSAWLFVHFGMILLTPLLGAAAHRLVEGLDSRPAQIARWALVPFLVLYPVWEALAGVATGRLVQLTGATSTTDPAATLVMDWFGWADNHWTALVGIAAWMVFAIAAAVAHRRAGAPAAVIVALGLASLYPILHGGVAALVPLTALSLAALLIARRRPAAIGAPTTPQP